MAAKVAIITGAARRVGAEIARILHQEGMNVVLHYHASLHEAERLSSELNLKRQHSACAVKADLNINGAGKILVQQAIDQWGRLDVLINNASRFYRTPFGKITEYAWEDLLNSNLKAPFFLAQFAAQYLRAHQGSIINITDIHAERPLRDYSVYCISKVGLLLMTKALAKELGPQIRVNAVAPGAVAWPEGENALSDEEKHKIIKSTALGRTGAPIDIAKTVLFLIRDADYITGQVINVDGGKSI